MGYKPFSFHKPIASPRRGGAIADGSGGDIELSEESIRASVFLVDMAGSIIKTESFTGKTCKLDLRRVPAGNYIVRINGEAAKWTDAQKIIVIK